MKLVVFGLTMSSSWGNGHATVWRGLSRALARRGHDVLFYERDVPYYAAHRDATEIPGVRLRLYPDWDGVVAEARSELSDADVGMVTSYCPDGLPASELVLDSQARLRTFYDLDTPVTLERLSSGEDVSYIGPRGFRDFDLVLSFTGGAALTELQNRLGARRVAPLYGSVDPEAHKPVLGLDQYRSDLSYLGTYSADRQNVLEALFLEPARRLPHRRFLIGGSLYPPDFPWTPNSFYLSHVPPGDHPAFYCSSRLTLNATRGPMARMGYCPSGRFFEAASCLTPILTDWWEGLNHFFEPGSEIVVAHGTDDAIAALEMSDAELAKIALAARGRTLEFHTADRRAIELEAALECLREAVSV